MKTIWKYRIDLGKWRGTTLELRMPKGAQVLYVGMQNGKPCMWVHVETRRRDAIRVFWLSGTGHKTPAGGRYLGTWIDRSFVWHLFEDPDEWEVTDG